jgi:hypothetical protein
MEAPQILNSLRLLFAFDKRPEQFSEQKALNIFCRGENRVFAGGFSENGCF